jgi:NADH dehydrogenase/NADH:ubiquinone oxidoreductase subunit G
MQELIFINEQPSYISLTNYPVFILICQVLGLELPRFCYHDSLVIAGNCRMCLIEDYKSPKPLIACALLVAPNDSFNLHTLKVKKAREGVLEFLLLNHPLDCPICDQGGECDLQDISFIFGSDRGRFHDYKRAVTLKNFNIFVKSIMTRCIHCTRCLRFATDFANAENLGLIGRGSSMEISTYLQVFIASGFFSNVVDLCPVGALTARAYSFIARPWELSFFYTFDILSIYVSPIKVMFRDNTILRILPCSQTISNMAFLVSSD